MLLFFLFSALVVSKPFTQSSQSLSLRTSLSEVRSQAQSPQLCSQGERSLVVDAKKRTQTLQWNIGSIDAVATPIQCETTMSTEYNPQWQYAVTEINWHAYANLVQGASATTGLSYGFGQAGTVLPVTLNWLITGPYDLPWDQKFRIPVSSQQWTPCGAVAPLTFQWSVKMTPNTKSLSTLFLSPGQLGKTTVAGGNLTLAITTEFRECTGALSQPAAPLIQPTPIRPQPVKPTPTPKDEEDGWKFWQ